MHGMGTRHTPGWKMNCGPSPLALRENSASEPLPSLAVLTLFTLQDEFYEAVNATATLDLDDAIDCIINLYEWNIRYLGGLLAAYDLSGEEVLLEKAIIIGDILHSAFETHNHMPCAHFPWPK